MAKYQDPKVHFVPDRTRIPLEEPIYEPCTTMYFDDDNVPPPPPRFKVEAPAGAPNVLVVLLDDMGYGASSVFGGPIPMPNAERIANQGMRFNKFHTTAICAPTRAALLSGYNHHSANMGCITELGTAYPGNLSTRPKTVTPMARVLRDNGYATGQFGKCHETPAWETTPSGPFDHWPTHSGFDKFYGFICAETNQFRPILTDGVTRIDIPEREDYHLTEDLADQCISWIRTVKTLTPDKPFFAYFAPGATHAPHHAPKKYLDMFKGEYDEGWDVHRERIYNNMKKMGIVPADTQLSKKPAAIKDWVDLSDKEKELFARQMEVYAGFAYHTDEHIGRIFDTLEEMNLMENTAVFYILGDNGASCEGRVNGVFNEQSTINRIPEPFDFVYSHMDELGTEASCNHYAMGWAVALDSPFRYAKTVASDFGGTRNAMVVSYPNSFKGNGEIHEQFHHVIDIAPTVYELAGIPIPEYVDGIKQRPMEGTSMVYAMKDAKAKDQHTTQYFNVLTNHGIYHEGWFAGVVDMLPWQARDLSKRVRDTPWELYDMTKDFSCSNNVAEQFPEKLEELKKIFFEEGVKHNVFPLETRGSLVMNADLAGRPTIMGNRKEITLFEGFPAIGEHAFMSMKNRDFTITAEIEVKPGEFTDGVLFAQGGRFGGYALYVKNGVPTFCYNWVAMEKYYVRAPKALTCERNQIVFDFKYDGGGFGLGGTGTLYVNNEKVAEGRIDKTIGNQISFDETADVGEQKATCVSEEYTIKESKFKGKIYSIHIKTGDAKLK